MADGSGRLDVVIPYAPRPQFAPLHGREKRWGVTVAHRRAGKTVACINELIRGAVTCAKTEPRFAYCAPFYAQAKDVAWSYLKRYTSVIPAVSVNESELRVDFPNGGRVRLYGLDNFDRLRGSYFDGVILDEWGDADPRAWQEVVRPALSDRRGWAIFIGTPRGRNHFSDLWDQARSDPDWFTLILKASETGLISAEELADARKTMTEDQYNAEYECSFQAAVLGSYYGREMERAEADKRIVRVPYDAAVPVFTAWDLGVSDSTAIWFVQLVGKEVHVIDYLENSGVGLDWYANALRQRGYMYHEHILPHDAQARELSSGKTREETLRSLGFNNIKILPQSSVADGINAARLLLPRAWFDAEKCKRGITCLQQYRREWDEKRKVFHDRPLHDWTSHGADAFRYLAVGLPEAIRKPKKLQYPKMGIV